MLGFKEYFFWHFYSAIFNSVKNWSRQLCSKLSLKSLQWILTLTCVGIFLQNPLYCALSLSIPGNLTSDTLFSSTEEEKEKSVTSMGHPLLWMGCHNYVYIAADINALIQRFIWDLVYIYHAWITVRHVHPSQGTIVEATTLTDRDGTFSSIPPAVGWAPFSGSSWRR